MQVRPEFAPFGVTDPKRLDSYLERGSFAQGECMMRQGTAGSECYLIEEGEVRLEIERPDFDSDGVVAYLQAGMLCGEFSFLDGRPRSASAYANTDVIASRLSGERLQHLCDSDPRTGLAVLCALGQDAAAKARQTAHHLEEFAFSDEIDPSVDRMVVAAAAAQAEELAAATVAETGIGNVADKTFKNRFASLQVNRTLQGKPGVGPRPTDDRGVTEIASPVGVVLGLIPMTNPVSTLVFKTLICLKARNALMVSHHPAAVGVGSRTVELIPGRFDLGPPRFSPRALALLKGRAPQGCQLRPRVPSRLSLEAMDPVAGLRAGRAAGYGAQRLVRRAARGRPPCGTGRPGSARPGRGAPPPW
jgi:acetaldehyde dehydrogenase/alcohol dehydrogenase